MAQIDIDLIEAYTREVARVCKQANEELDWRDKTIAELKQAYNEACKVVTGMECELRELKDRLDAMQSKPQWHDATEVPPDGTRCIVRTDIGATYFFEPVCGRWKKDIVKWMYTPE